MALTHPLPSLVAHSDWSCTAEKRWISKAVRLADGRYRALAPEAVQDGRDLLPRLRTERGEAGCLLAGFDFPIGLPHAYAVRAGISDFLAFLAGSEQEPWQDFYRVADWPDQVSLGRPFYPRRPGSARLTHLLEGLGLEKLDQLRRLCERAQPGRRPAAPLFWTLGGQQVGKAAISGWQEVLLPALKTISLWPFCGRLPDLIRPGGIVIAETYPAEFYAPLGVKFSNPRAGQRSGKRVQSERAACAPALFAWSVKAQVDLDPLMERMLLDGFGARPDGEDRFDSAVGLFGMLNVLTGFQPEGESLETEPVRKIEGWILGHHRTEVAV